MPEIEYQTPKQERLAEPESLVSRAMGKISDIYEKVKISLGIEGPKAVAETDEFLVATAEETNRVDDVETVIVEGSLESVGTIVSSGDNPIDTIEDSELTDVVSEAIRELGVEDARLPTGESVAETAVGQIMDHERKVNKYDADAETAEAEASIEAFLEREVYSEFGVSAEQEAVRISELEEKSETEARIDLERRSFANVRETTKLFFVSLTEEGVYDNDIAKSIEIERQKAAESNYIKSVVASDPRYEKYAHVATYGDIDDEASKLRVRLMAREEELDVSVVDLSHREENLAKIAGDSVSNEIRSELSLLQELQSGYRTTDNEQKLAAATSMRETISEMTVTVSREEALDRLRAEFDSTKANHDITLNLHPGALGMIIASGEIVSSASLDREHLRDLVEVVKTSSTDQRYRSEYSADDYMYMRARVEKELGLEPGTVIYGAISTDEEPLGHTCYGDCCIVFKQDSIPDATFTEGDSLSPIWRGMYRTKDLERSTRQLTYEHAVLSQAITRAFHDIERAHLEGYDSDEFMEYLEAQISTPIPFDQDHILEIRVGDSVDIHAFSETGIPIKVVPVSP